MPYYLKYGLFLAIGLAGAIFIDPAFPAWLALCMAADLYASKHAEHVMFAKIAEGCIDKAVELSKKGNEAHLRGMHIMIRNELREIKK